MAFYRDWLFPRLLDLVMQQKQMTRFREQVGQAAEGRVLDVGIGSGLNLPFYGSRASRVFGVDPSVPLLQLAKQRVNETNVPVELVPGSAEALPFDARDMDTAVVTFTLCSVENAAASLAEIRRVLKPGGKLLFAEHGRAPDARVARWQDRLTPAWKWIAGGCHLNRKMDDLLTASGFRIDALTNPRLPGPRTHAYLYEGRARPS